MGSIVVSFGAQRQQEPQRRLRPVTAVAAVGQHGSAMRVRKSEMHDGSWIYEQEVPLRFGDAFRAPPPPHVPTPFIRFEVKSLASERQLAAGDWLVVAVHPYETCLIEISAFKRPLAENETMPLAGPDLDGWLDKLDYDPWEASGWLTAAPRALSQPSGTSWLQTRGEQRRVLGICPGDVPFEEIVADIARTKTMQEAAARLDASPDLVDVSIRQALAGPVADSMSHLTKPVADLAASLLEKHVARAGAQP